MNFHYFNALEEDVLRTSRYVEFSEQNFSTYSVEFVRLLLAAGSEVDVVCKNLIKMFSPSAKPKNITDYRKYLLNEFPEIGSDIVHCPRFGFRLHPWKGWSAHHPDWWKAYNDVKHDRTSRYQDGNLKNVLLATSALGVVMQYFGKYLGMNAWSGFKGNLFLLHLTTITRASP